MYIRFLLSNDLAMVLPSHSSFPGMAIMKIRLLMQSYLCIKGDDLGSGRYWYLRI